MVAICSPSGNVGMREKSGLTNEGDRDLDFGNPIDQRHPAVRSRLQEMRDAVLPGTLGHGDVQNIIMQIPRLLFRQALEPPARILSDQHRTPEQC